MLQKFYKKIIIATFALAFYAGTAFNPIHAACSSEQPITTEASIATKPVVDQTLNQQDTLEKEKASPKFKKFQDDLELALSQIHKGLLFHHEIQVIEVGTPLISSLLIASGVYAKYQQWFSNVDCALGALGISLGLIGMTCLIEGSFKREKNLLLYTGVTTLLRFETMPKTQLEQGYLKARLDRKPFSAEAIKIINQIKKELTYSPIETDINVVPYK